MTEGYELCVACQQRRNVVGIADRVGFLTYAWPQSQPGRVMHAYKTNAALTSFSLVRSLVTYGVAAHWDCINGPEISASGGTPNAWSFVPSLSGRAGTRALGLISADLLKSIPQVNLAAAGVVQESRSFRPANFLVTGRPAGAHVLLLEDTWVGGGHVESAAAALKQAGAGRVTVLSVARWLDPNWADTRAFIGALTDDFDPDLCPYSGQPCS